MIIIFGWNQIRSIFPFKKINPLLAVFGVGPESVAMPFEVAGIGGVSGSLLSPSSKNEAVLNSSNPTAVS